MAARETPVARRLLRALGWSLLGLAAASGVILSALVATLSTRAGRSLVASRLVRMADGAIQGSIDAEVGLAPQGGIEIVGLRLSAPEGEVVLAIDRIQVVPDISRITSGILGARVELDRPSVVLRRGRDGDLSLVRALRPARPATAQGGGLSGWTPRLVRLVVREGEVRFFGADAGEEPSFAARLDAEARGYCAGSRCGVELRVRGEATAPERVPLALDVAASSRGSAVRVPVLRASAGSTSLDAMGEGDWAMRTGRLAATSLRISGSELAALTGRELPAGELSGTLYAESDGAVAGAVLEVKPEAGRSGGSAAAAVAVRLPPSALAVGFDLRTDRLDPSRLVPLAPPGEISLDARGRGAGVDLASLHGALALSLAPSRLRSGRIGPLELRADVRGAVVEVTRLEATVPGGTLTGRGRWLRGGALAAQVDAQVADLGLALRNLSGLLGRPLPQLGGTARLTVTASGTTATPRLALALSSGALSVAGVSASAVEASAEVSGSAAQLQLTASVPSLGREPIEVAASGALSPDRKILAVDALSLGWPGTRFDLARPARVELGGPSVDRLEIASGPARVVVEGGLRGAELDVRAEVSRLELGRLPWLLLGERLVPAGRLSLRGGASGPVTAPSATLHAELEEGAALGLSGVSAAADLRFDGPHGRVSGEVALRLAKGGEMEIRADAPARLDRALPHEPLDGRVIVRSLPVSEALAAAGVALPLSGTASLEAEIAGTVGAPRLAGRATLASAAWADLGPWDVRLVFDDPGSKLTLRAEAAEGGTRALEGEASVPIDLSNLVRAPAATVRRLRRAPFEATAAVPFYDLGRIAGRSGIPGDLGGIVEASASLRGSLDAPRGRLSATLSAGSWGGRRELGATALVEAEAAETRLSARGTAGGQEVLRLAGALGAPVERLAERALVERAPVRLDVQVPGADLARTGLPLAGSVAASFSVVGSLADPRADLTVKGSRLQAGVRPLGDLALSAKATARSLRADLELLAAGGGRLTGELAAEGGVALASLEHGGLASAPASARATARNLDLGFLPAVMAGHVRMASGKLNADVEATGPLLRMRPRGTIEIAEGSATVAGLGEWTGVAVKAAATDDEIVVDPLSARHGGGRLDARLSVKGLARPGGPADVAGKLAATRLTVARAGMEVATFDLEAELEGKVDRGSLDATLLVPGGTLTLPKQLPRRVQTLEPRPDITVLPVATAPVESLAARMRSYRASLRVLVPGRFFVKSDSARLNMELRADVTVAPQDGALGYTGTIDTISGRLEPFSGRIFDVVRARVTLPGGDFTEAVVDAAALYENPAFKVTVAVDGPLASPRYKMTSEPPLDESQIAMLIATGRTELKAGAGGVGALGGEEAGRVAISALSTQAFESLLADRLPLDQVSVDSSRLRAGKYITDRIYVGYTSRFDARSDRGENANEVRVEYQISPHWALESRYGDAGSGGGSIVWSRDY